MRLIRQVLPGLLIAMFSIVIITGVLVLSFAEGSTPAPTRTRTPTQPPTATFTQQQNRTVTPSHTPPPATETLTLTSSPTGCPPPEGWSAYVVETGDTLEGLAARYHTSLEDFLQANCIVEESLPVGSQIYVPPLPTPTSEKCGPPDGWVTYRVQRGDTLYHLSQVYGITVKELQYANCMGTSTLLVVGKMLYVPPWAPTLPTPTYPFYYTETPTWTVIVPDTWTPAPTDTNTP